MSFGPPAELWRDVCAGVKLRPPRQVRALLPLIQTWTCGTIATIAGAPFRHRYLILWHPRFHPYPDLPH